MADGTWHRVIVTVATDAVEVAADVLWTHGTAAVEERAGTGGTCLLGGFDDPARAEAAARAVRGFAVDGDVAVVPVDDDGSDGWRDWASVERGGPFVLAPAWRPRPDVTADEHLLLLDPGPTFGSGSHPTTRLVLEAIADLVAPGDRVLDVGCGSGVLAIGAAVLGATAHGIDIDPAAPAATRQNAAANGVADAVTVSNEPLADVRVRGDRFDVVVANLLAPVLVDLVDDLRAVGRHARGLVISGLLDDRWRATTDVFTADGSWVVQEHRSLDGWEAVVLARSGDDEHRYPPSP